MTSYYFASRYSRHAELAACRDELQASVPWAEVTSRWIDCHDGELENSYTPEALNADPEGCWRHGQSDLDDLDAAGVLVSFTGPGGKGGRHIEHGYALAMYPYCLDRIVIVGVRENIFHCHPATEVYPSWEAFLAHEVAEWVAS